MRTLPTTMIRVLAPFAPLFSNCVFQHVQLLLTGLILAPGKRTVASALRAVGLPLPSGLKLCRLVNSGSDSPLAGFAR